MIPRNTPIGTELICINTREWFFKSPSDAPSCPGSPSQLDGLTEGRHYRLRSYGPCDDLIAGFRIHVQEILRREYDEESTGVAVEVGYAPQRFKALDVLKTREGAQRENAVPVATRDRVRELKDA